MVIGQLLRDAWHEWRDDRAQTHSAALAFYALFSVAPLVLVATAVVGAVFGTERAQAELGRELQGLLTPEIADVVQTLVADAANRGSRWAAGSIGVLVSLYGAGRGFLQLQVVLNDLWGVRVSTRGLPVVDVVRRRLVAFSSVALCGVLLMASLTATILLHGLADRLTSRLDLSFLTLRLTEELSSFSLVSLLLVVVYRTLPDARIRWDDAIVGSFVSAALFVVGKYAVSYYLRYFGATSTFGAAGALVALMLYVRYTAQVLLFGAEFTFVFARWRGHPIQPAPGAVVDHPPGEHHV